MALSRSFDVFLSHNSKDKPWVIKLKYDLEIRHVKVWLDQDEIRPGDLFAQALEDGIAQSRSVALIISPASMRSGWVRAEYYRALDLAMKRSLQLIPVLYKKAQIPGFLSDRNWVDFSDPSQYERSLGRLIWGITGIKPEGPSSTTSEAERESELFKALRAFVASADEIVQAQKRLLSAGLPFYEDQLGRLTEQVEQLRDIAENLREILPANYDNLAAAIELVEQVNSQAALLAEFPKTSPLGDREPFDNFLEQVELTSQSVEKISRMVNRSIH